ncbi:zeta toxin family protein [Anaerofilum sp. BX8]|uniref:UDP-N-acetylglucosamine kinase n=1 Tax=Anaerofilum hominis TaxID=2763016 RepID=A0A923REX5_9FIRM|nr:zeta toxin family protein [Anaerofilum hominis]MBC5582540.1 zeta toxin family protein [Anaerofilum hominis]
MKKHLFLIGGASGCGKTAICQMLAGTMGKVICLDGDSL